jgi:hypothetical protein
MNAFLLFSQIESDSCGLTRPSASSCPLSRPGVGGDVWVWVEQEESPRKQRRRSRVMPDNLKTEAEVNMADSPKKELKALEAPLIGMRLF